MESDMAVYKSDFLQEIYECLDIFNQSFVDLENGDTAAIDEIFRITHTIKGMAGFLGYTSLEYLCHSMEEVLCGIKNGEIEIDGELVDILLSTVDRIIDIVKQIESADNDNVKIEDLLEAFENYEKTRDEEHEPLCTLDEKSKASPLQVISAQQSGGNLSPNPESECQGKMENGGACNLDECNLVLDVTLVKDCVMKGLRASLIVESLKDVCKLAKTEPDEDDMDNSFDGHFKVFISGDSSQVEGLMDRISEIEQFSISEIEFSNIGSGEEIKCEIPISEELRPDNSSNPAVEPEAIAVSVPCGSNKFSSCIYGLIERIRCILNGLSRPINGFKITESAEVLARKKCRDFSTDNSEPQKARVTGNDPEMSPAVFDQDLQQGEVKTSCQAHEEVLDMDNFDKGDSDKGQLYKVTSFKASSGKFAPDEIASDKFVPDNINPDPDTPDKVTNCGASSGPDTPDNTPDNVNFCLTAPDNVTPDLAVPDEINFSQKLRLDEALPLEEDSEEFPDQGLQMQESRETGKSGVCSGNHFSEPAASAKAPLEIQRQETIRVRTSNLDNIMNLVGELVINKGRLLQISQEYNLPELEEATGTLDKSISSLQDEVMRIRMVKIERVFSKFPRMVRDLSRKFDKNIDFEIEGQDTELDRTILDEISDPLVHLVRNAVDHGVESPEERKKAGKSETGRIKLSARREKNNVIIEIEDDGKGMDVEVLKKKAVEKGVLSPFDAENLSEEEIRMIIFAPGFSTKDTPTEISGRGVGMDAVKTAVEKLGGKVRIYSKEGEFTRIRIDLPPTVAIIKSLLVEVGPETYAIPISNVVKALSVDSSDYKLVKETPVLYIGDKLIPVTELKEIFNVECEKLDKEIAIIVEKENEEVGLIVDSIIDQQEIVIKPLGNIFSNSTGLIGATILGDGRVIPIIDVPMLIKGDIDD